MENQLLQTAQGVDTNSDVTTGALPEGAIARLGRGCVHDMAFSPAGEYLAIGSRIGLWWYKLPSLYPIALWETERGLVSAVAFSPCGNRLVTGNWDGDIKVWNVQQAELLVKLKISSLTDKKVPVKQVTFSPDGRCLAVSGSEDVVYVWRLETGDLIAKFSGEVEKRSCPWSSIIPLSFSPDGCLLASTNFDNTVSIWNVEKNERIACFTGHTSWVYSVCFSPCGQFLASGDREGTLRVWDFIRGVQEMVSSEYATYRAMPFYSPSGALLAAGSYEDKVVIWDVSQQEKLGTFVHRGFATAARFSGCGTQLAVASSRELKVWTVDNPSTVSSVPGHTGVPFSMTFSPDGKTLASLEGSNVLFWDVACKRLRATFEKNTGIRSFVYLASGKMLTASTCDTTVTVWDVGKSGKLIAEFTEHQKRVRVVTFSPTGNRMATVDVEGKFYVWDVQCCQKLSTLKGDTDGIRSVVFSPDGKQLVSASENKTVLLWDVERGEEIACLANKVPSRRSIETIAFSPCGNVIAGGLYSELRLWSVKTRETLYSIQPPPGCQWPFALAFSPCGRYLASGAWYIPKMSKEKVSIRLWEVASGENIATLWGHPTDVQSLAFSPDGELLASGSFDGTILLWDVSSYL